MENQELKKEEKPKGEPDLTFAFSCVCGSIHTLYLNQKEIETILEDVKAHQIPKIKFRRSSQFPIRHIPDKQHPTMRAVA